MKTSKPVFAIHSDIDQQLHHSSLVDPSIYLNGRSINALISPELTLDKLIAFMTTINDIFNSKTNNTKLDKLMRTYHNLHKSRGYNAFKNLLSLWSVFINSIDVMLNIFRAYEVRALNSKELNKPPESNPLEALKSSIDDVNTNFAEVANLIQTLNRMGELDYLFVDKQDDDANETKDVQQSLLQVMPQDEERIEDNEEEDDDVTGKNSRDYENNEDYETEGSVYPGQDRLVNIYQNYPQQPSVQTNRHFFYATFNSAKGWQNRHLPHDRMIPGGPRYR